MSKLYIIGIGPGKPQYMTQDAKDALESSDVICGYTVYVDLVSGLYPNKETYTTAMTKEIDRCRWALESASQGKDVAMVCSGDSGVYGMAAPILELSPLYPDVDIEVIPGVTAALSGGSVLGAPLGHDFCVISLSDLLTPWELIKKRLEAASYGDFCICIYNPCSRRRKDHLKNACEILLKHKSPDTVCGWVKNIGRDGQDSFITTLLELKDAQLDMFTTVFIGSSATKNINGRMVTPRGYQNK